MSICPLINTLYLRLWHSLNIITFYAVQCWFLLYQQYLKKKWSSFSILSTSAIIFITFQNCHHMTNHMRYKGNINNTSVIIFLMGSFLNLVIFLRLFPSTKFTSWMSFVNSRKPPAMVTSRRFLWCWLLLLLFSSLDVFTFPDFFFHATGTPPLLLKPLKPLSALSFNLASLGCYTFPRLFGHILSGHFLPTGPFYLALLPHIFGTFYPILLCACPHKVVPTGWRMALNYSYCRYKTIG